MNLASIAMAMLFGFCAGVVFTSSVKPKPDAPASLVRASERADYTRERLKSALREIEGSLDGVERVRREIAGAADACGNGGQQEGRE